MCKCTPNIRTPFCGKPGCEWPEQRSSNSAVYEVQEGMDRDLNKEFRVTDTRTDSRVATCYVQSNADLVCAALNAYTAVEPSAGVKCTHCNGNGYNEPIYDEQDGWIDETPCETCNGSGRITTVEQYLKTLPANWHEDSSLETWFPITAEELKRLKDERASQPPTADLLGALRDARRYVEAYEPRDVSEAHDRDLMLNSIDALAPSTKDAGECGACDKPGEHR